MVTRLIRFAAVFVGLFLVAGAGACKNNTTLPTPVLATEVFTGTLAPGATKSHNFNVDYAFSSSTATLTVTSLTNAATGAALSTTIGAGFGQPGFDQTCVLATAYSTQTATIGVELGPAPVTQGQFCVQIFDAGTLTNLGVSANYSVSVKHY
jgi:hypothetical protein